MLNFFRYAQANIYTPIPKPFNCDNSSNRSINTLKYLIFRGLLASVRISWIEDKQALKTLAIEYIPP